jgi:hypothetical protein
MTVCEDERKLSAPSDRLVLTPYLYLYPCYGALLRLALFLRPQSAMCARHCPRRRHGLWPLCH